MPRLTPEEQSEGHRLVKQVRRQEAERTVRRNGSPQRAQAATPTNGAPSTNGHAAACRAIPVYQPFPIEALPHGCRSYCREGAAALGCDPAFIALPILSVLASAIGNTRTIRLKRGWTEPAVLWTAIIGDSGTLKSPAYFLAVHHLFAVQEDLLAGHKAELADHQDALADWKKQRAAANKGEAADPGEKPVTPALRRVIVSDTTIEKLGEILEDNPRGTLVARDELAGWLSSFTRYKGKQGGSDVPNWLELNRAGTLLIDRKTGDRRTVYVKRAAASVTGGIQPSVLARALTADLLESGLAARLLLCWPPRLPKQWSEAEVDPGTEAVFRALLDKLLALDFDRHNGHPVPRVLCLSDKARAVWIEWFGRWAREQAAAEGELAAAYSKLEGYAARFALVYHCTAYALADADDKVPIDAEAMRAGITLAEWFAGEARRIYSIVTESEDERETRRLVEFLHSRDGSLTAKELQRSNSRKYPTAASASAALNSLGAAGLGEWIDRAAGPKGGRPTRTFRLYPTAPDDTDETDQTPTGAAQAADETADETPADP